MSGGFFIVGGIIFSVYIYFTLWNINTSARKSREENYPSIGKVDVVDMDGHGNYGRFPIQKTTKKRIIKRKQNV